MPDPVFSPAPGGVDKHRAAAYLTITKGGVTRRFFSYTRVSYSETVEIRENTNPASPTTQNQIMRKDTPTFEIEVNVPFDEEQAGIYLTFLRAGSLLDNFDIKSIESDGVTHTGLFFDGQLAQYGKYIIERSSINVSRDDFTTVSATIRGLGYTRGQNLPPVEMPR